MGYYFTFVKESDPYYGAWVDMRRRTWMFWICAIGGLPVTFALVVLIEWWLGAESIWAAIPTVLVLLTLRVYQAYWPCPRCASPFFATSLFMYWPFADHCLHCGLAKYAPDGGEATSIGVHSREA